MNIFDILKNLYTNRKIDWLFKIEDNEIAPYVIQRWLAMNDSVRIQTRWLDKYVFVLPPKMYLSLAWSILPKTQRTPFIKYIKKVDEEEKFDFILVKVIKHMNLSNNDYNKNKSRIIEMIKKDMVNWFSFYGVPKYYWKKNYINFSQIKSFGPEAPKEQKGLDIWGM